MARNQTQFTKPLYFAAGATDLAVEKLREIPAEYKRLQDQAKRVDAATVRVAVEDYSSKATVKAVQVYDELVDRGQKLARNVRRQKASQVLAERVDATRSQLKGTATTARKSAASTKTRAKATTTSAKKTTEAAADAVKDGASKVG
ncbi:MAG: hypothetical protein WCB04_14290 [Mycobacteriales bacterium]